MGIGAITANRTDLSAIVRRQELWAQGLANPTDDIKQQPGADEFERVKTSHAQFVAMRDLQKPEAQVVSGKREIVACREGAMRVMAMVVAALGVLAVREPAKACEVAVDGRVVAFGASSDAAVVRIETAGSGLPAVIRLQEWDLKNGRRGQVYSILEEKDDEDPKIRAARWKSAEAALTKKGFKFAPKPQECEGARVAMLDARIATRLRADKKKEEILLVGKKRSHVIGLIDARNPEGSAMEMPGPDLVYVTPDQRRVIFIAGAGCGAEPEFLVFDAARLRDKLSAAAGAP